MLLPSSRGTILAHVPYMHTPALADTIATPLTSCTSTLQNSILNSVGGVSLTAKQLRSSTHVLASYVRVNVDTCHASQISAARPNLANHILETPQRGIIGACCLIRHWPNESSQVVGNSRCSMGSICHNVFYQREQLFLKPVTRKVHEILREIYAHASSRWMCACSRIDVSTY